MMTVMTGAALVRKVCYSYTLQRRNPTHMFASHLLSDGLRSVAPDAPPQPQAAGRQAINEPHFQEVESDLKEKCRKAFVKYDEPGQDEDYLLGSGDIEEEEKAKKATYKRRNKLRMRISREWARYQRILDEARRAAFGFCRYRRECIVCSKINNRTFDSEKERKLHTSAEYYEVFLGEDYEKKIRAVFDRGFLKHFDGTLEEIEEVKRSFLDRMDRFPRHICNHCRECYNECVMDTPEDYHDRDQFEEMLDIVATRRPLLFDVRVDGPDFDHYLKEVLNVATVSVEERLDMLWGNLSWCLSVNNKDCLTNKVLSI